MPIKLAAQSNISTRVRPRVAHREREWGGAWGYAYGRHKCVWHEMSCKSFWQHFKRKKEKQQQQRGVTSPSETPFDCQRSGAMGGACRGVGEGVGKLL